MSQKPLDYLATEVQNERGHRKNDGEPLYNAIVEDLLQFFERRIATARLIAREEDENPNPSTPPRRENL